MRTYLTLSLMTLAAAACESGLINPIGDLDECPLPAGAFPPTDCALIRGSVRSPAGVPRRGFPVRVDSYSWAPTITPRMRPSPTRTGEFTLTVIPGQVGMEPPADSGHGAPGDQDLCFSRTRCPAIHRPVGSGILMYFAELGQPRARHVHRPDYSESRIDDTDHDRACPGGSLLPGHPVGRHDALRKNQPVLRSPPGRTRCSKCGREARGLGQNGAWAERSGGERRRLRERLSIGRAVELDLERAIGRIGQEPERVIGRGGGGEGVDRSARGIGEHRTRWLPRSPGELSYCTTPQPPRQVSERPGSSRAATGCPGPR